MAEFTYEKLKSLLDAYESNHHYAKVMKYILVLIVFILVGMLIYFLIQGELTLAAVLQLYKPILGISAYGVIIWLFKEMREDQKDLLRNELLKGIADSEVYEQIKDSEISPAEMKEILMSWTKDIKS